MELKKYRKRIPCWEMTAVYSLTFWTTVFTFTLTPLELSVWKGRDVFVSTVNKFLW